MRQRFVLLSLLVPVGLFIAAATALIWLLETEAGLHWAYARLRSHLPGTLETRALTGKLAGPIEVRDLSYNSDSMDARIAHAEVDWSPGALLLGRLEIDRVTVDGANVTVKRAAPSQPRRSPKFNFPLNVSLSQIHLSNIEIERPGHGPYMIRRIKLAGFVGQEVARIDQLTVDAQNVAVDAAGTLGLSEGTHQTLRIKWRVEPPGRAPIRGGGEISGNLAKLEFTQQIDAPLAITIRGAVRRPLTDPQWRLDATAPEFDLRRIGSIRRSVAATVSMNASGGRSDFEAKGTLRAHGPDLPSVVGAFAFHGAVSGEEIVVDELTLRVPESDAQLAAQGSWHPRDETWKARLHWYQLQWPTNGDVAVASPEGQIEADGNYETYRLRAELAVAAAQAPHMRWRATGSGDRSGVRFNDIAVDTLGATLHGKAHVLWSPRLAWDASLGGSGINPAVQWAGWDGSLALEAALSGDAAAQQLRIKTLRGTLRGKPFRASASVVRRGHDYPQLSFGVEAGAATLNVAGSVGARWDMSWRLRIPQAAALADRANGRVESSGTLSGPRAQPQIEAHATATELSYATTRVGAAKLDATVDLSDTGRSHVALSVMHGAVLGRDFESIAVNIDGNRTNHTISVDAGLPNAVLQARLHGNYSNGTWRGSIGRSELRIADKHWTLEGQPALVLSRRRIDSDRTCWRADGAQACFELRRAVAAATSVSVTVTQLPLAVFAPLLVNPPEWDGTVSGNAALRFNADHLASADAQLDFSAGSVTLASTTKTKLAYTGATARLRVDDRGLHANGTVALPDGDGGRIEFALPRFHSDAAIRHQPANGRLTFSMTDITPLAALLPQLEEVSGAIHLNFTLGGSLADPHVTGEAALTGAAARIAVSGVRVHDVRITVSADGGDELQLHSGAQAGGGNLALGGRILFSEDRAWRAELHITGERFHVVDLRENQVFVSPDLHARLSPGQIDVTGDVRLPQASVALRSPKNDVVVTSPDVLVVNAPAGAPVPEPRWKVTAQINVSLGEAVTFSGFGLSAKIAGAVTLIEAPGQPTTARGELRVEKGQYEAYGQKLTVERGRLVFVGGPVANPGIDARAVRNVDQVTAGVQVKGTLQQPQLTLFSDPAMSESDTLSYLLFGRPLEGASAAEGRSLATAARALKLVGGERLAQRIGSRFGFEEVDIETGTNNQAAALVLGKRLSPRLYINYSIGLFTPANVLQLKYKLGKHWSLEAQSGAEAGGDLIYTIER